MSGRCRSRSPRERRDKTDDRDRTNDKDRRDKPDDRKRRDKTDVKERTDRATDKESKREGRRDRSDHRSSDKKEKERTSKYEGHHSKRELSPTNIKRRDHSQKEKKRPTSPSRRSDKKKSKKSKNREVLSQYDLDRLQEEKVILGMEADPKDKFIWVKKDKLELKKGLSKEERDRNEKERREEAKMELERLNQRRAEREGEIEAREQDQMRQQRESDLNTLGDWESRELEFHLDQAKRRAEIRIRNHRAKPIDILAMNLKLTCQHQNPADFEPEFNDDLPLDIMLEDPTTLFDTLALPELVDLNQDIQLYLALERDSINQTFWADMLILCDDKITTLRNELDHGKGVRINKEVMDQIDELMSNKNLKELEELQIRIIDKMKNESKLDLDYWEQNLKSITVWKAKNRLKQHHEVVLSKRLEQLRAKQMEDAQQAQHDLQIALQFQSANQEEYSELESKSKDKDDSLPQTEYDPNMSPKLIPHHRLAAKDQDLEIITYEDDRLELLKLRQEILNQIQTKGLAKRNKLNKSNDPNNTDEGRSKVIDFAAKLFQEEKEDRARKGEELDIDEEIFDLEVQLESQSTTTDTHQPRKPMYFNRVNTGYEWNKYNQTHYDFDNPPPKLVQGYKFHLFYPNLLPDPITNKKPTPTYRLEPDPLSPDTQIIRFISGPPYQDIAFRIVKKEWEFSHKKGFKSMFVNDTLFLYFLFRRLHYRR